MVTRISIAHFALTAAVKEFDPNFGATMPIPPLEILCADYSATPASSSNSTLVGNNDDDNSDDVVLGDWSSSCI